MNTINKSYIVATIKSWNIDQYYNNINKLPGRWTLITSPDGLDIDALYKINPRYVFFPHWSWAVPEEILTKFECVCFHMSDVPYGRGGSPLQNLIVRGHKTTKLTALKMIQDLDAGPVYGKLDLSLNGSAEEIFCRAAELCYIHIKKIIMDEPSPVPQEGKVVVFSRRKPDESVLPYNEDLEKLYDHIRMLDAETYPRAFIDYGNITLEFSGACFYSDDRLEARVTFKRKPE